MKCLYGTACVPETQCGIQSDGITLTTVMLRACAASGRRQPLSFPLSTLCQIPSGSCACAHDDIEGWAFQWDWVVLWCLLLVRGHLRGTVGWTRFSADVC